MKFYGYEDYTVNFLCSTFWKGAANNYSIPLKGYSNHAYSGICNIRIDDGNEFTKKAAKGFDIDRLKELEPLKSKLYVPKDGECLYFDKNCMIPRIKCDKKWKRTIKIANSNVVVIPTFEQPRLFEDNIVLVNDRNKQIFIQEYAHDVPIKPEIGDTFDQMLEDNSPFIRKVDMEYKDSTEMIPLAKGAKVLYIGSLYYYSHKAEPLFSVADGLYPKVIFEEDLMDLLGDEDNQFTAEKVQSLIELISSPDRDTVHQGLRILAEMDYAHYPSVTRYILKTTERRWNSCKPFNSAVQFMFKKVRNYGFYYPFDHVTPEEFEIAKDIFHKLTTMEIEEFLNRIRQSTNIQVLCDYKLELQLKPAVDQSEDSELTSIQVEENDGIEKNQ